MTSHNVIVLHIITSAVGNLLTSFLGLDNILYVGYALALGCLGLGQYLLCSHQRHASDSSVTIWYAPQELKSFHS